MSGSVSSSWAYCSIRASNCEGVLGVLFGRLSGFQLAYQELACLENTSTFLVNR